MPAERLPWFKFWIGATAHAKARNLDDGTFRTWVELLDLSAQQPKRGRFASRREAVAVSRRPAKHVARLIEAKLIDETPDGLVMHDWDDWQRWRKGDANDPGIDPRTTNERPPDQPLNDQRIDPSNNLGNYPLIDQFSRVRASAPVSREERREKREERRKTKERDVAVVAVEGGVGGTNGFRSLAALLQTRHMDHAPSELEASRDEQRRRQQQQLEDPERRHEC